MTRRGHSGDTRGDLDPVWKALADPTRRAILDLLRGGPCTTMEIVARFPDLTRFGVMKHLAVLRDAGLVQDRWEGRRRINSLNVIPLRNIYERWVSGYQDLWASKLTSLKRSLEDPPRKGTKR
jgi:DNA-binding transcriptional ArsR family regulator